MNSFLTKNAPRIALSLRGVQIFVSLLIIILAAVNLAITGYTKGYIRKSVISGSINFCYYAVVTTPVGQWCAPIVIICWELATLSLWAVALGYSSVLYRDVDCSRVTWKGECRTGVGSFALGIIGFILSFTTLALLIAFSFVPACKKAEVFSCKYFSMGAIFPRSRVVDQEAGGFDDKPSDGGFVVRHVTRGQVKR